MQEYKWLPAITAVFVTSLILSNIIAVKLVSLGSMVLAASVLVFPISYIFGDVLTEVYGYARSRQVIWIGFSCNLLAVAVIWLSIELPAAPFWAMGHFDGPEASQRAYESALGFTPRLLVSSFCSYVCGEFLNSFVMAKMKIMTNGRYLWMRTIGSTLVGQFVDSGIFITLSFYGLVPTQELVGIATAQWLTKSAYEALATPFTYAVANFLKRSEKVDVYDHETNFSPFLWKEG